MSTLDDAICGFALEPEYDDDDDSLDECCFPSTCLMPGYHLRSECHTAEMLEDYDESAASVPAQEETKP